MPCAATSSSMPMIFARFAVMSSSRRAEWAAIETWSSWLALVGVESIEPGIGALLVLGKERCGRHLGDHEAGVEARLGRRETPAGRSSKPDRRGSRCAARRWRRSPRGRARSCRRRRRRARRGSCRPRRSRPSPISTSGLSVTALASISSVRAALAEQVETGAHHLRLAAEAIGILHALVALDDAICG